MWFQYLYTLYASVLGNSNLFNTIVLLLAILGVVLSFAFYFLGKRNRVPTYAIRSVNLVDGDVDGIGDVDISYHGAKVKNLSVARIALWNRGAETINYTDVASSDPLRIVSLNSSKLLGISIVYEKNKANKFLLQPVVNPEKPQEHKQDELNIVFDYFDKNEGIILQVFYTGDRTNGVLITGTIKGYGTIKRTNETIIQKLRPATSYLDKMKRKHKKLMFGIVLYITPAILLLGMYFPVGLSKVNSVMGYAQLAIITAFYWTLGFSMMRRRVPKGFDLFEEEIRTSLRQL